jgi:serine phosphatase RsbU (regulator of sigma subunit)
MEQFSETRFIQTIGKAHNMSLKEMINKTEQELRDWRGEDEFQDDVTLLAIQIPNTGS